GYPVRAIGEASLDDLNSRIDASQKAASEASAFRPLPMNRFRANIVVSGSTAYDEDNWEKISINGSVFRATKPCARCVVTTIDQIAGAIAGNEPLKTLSQYRQAKDVIPDRLERLGMSETAVLFGQNLIVENFGNVIRVGDTVGIDLRSNQLVSGK
ncbi:MAG: MOSC domain-containing protein, partial [Pyrinomonadaceae bacterium]